MVSSKEITNLAKIFFQSAKEEKLYGQFCTWADLATHEKREFKREAKYFLYKVAPDDWPDHILEMWMNFNKLKRKL